MRFGLLKVVMLVAVGSAGLIAAAADNSGKQARRHDRGLVLTLDDAHAIATNRKGFKDLSYLSTLAPDVARVLVASKGTINLSGLGELPVELASVLSGREDDEIHLDGLQAISAESLRAIAGGGLWAVSLDGVRQMPDDVFAVLLESKSTVLCGLERLPPKAGELLAKRCPTRVYWPRLHQISDVELKAIVDRAPVIVLGLKSLTPRQAELLSGCKKQLVLDGVTSLDAGTARLLTQRKDKTSISLAGLETLDRDAKDCLDSHGKVSYTVKPRSEQKVPTYRAEDVAAVLDFAMRSAKWSHSVAQTLSKAAMAGVGGERVIAIAKEGITGFEQVEIAMLSKCREAMARDDVALKAITAIEALQSHVLAELRVAQALAESRASDESRDAFGDLAGDYERVQDRCETAVRDVRARVGETTPPRAGRSEDIQMAMVFAFQEARKGHLLAESMLQSLRGMPREEVTMQCEKVIASWLAEPAYGSVAGLHQYLNSVEHGEHDRAVLDAIGQLQDCVLAEFRGVKACARSVRIDRAALAPFVNANEKYDTVLRPLATTIGGILRGKPAAGSGQTGGAASPNPRVFSDAEWAGVVAVLLKQGMVRSPEDARAYFGTFVLLKGVFVEKGIAEPSAKQLFGLAKTLSVAFGEMAPAKIETTLKAMLQLAKETSTEVASKDDLISMGK